MGDVLIPSLVPGNCTDLIRVRVSRFWEFFDPQQETKLLHADLVLIDEEGNNIHAQIHPDIQQQFKQIIKEGSVYDVSYFRVKTSSMFYKPVARDNMITFTKWTTIEEVVEVPPAFPIYAYSFKPFEQISSLVNSKEYFIDVIGVVTRITSISSIRTRSMQASSLKRTITMRNASNTLANIVLWGERASAFQGEQLYQDGAVSLQIVVFVGMLAKKISDGLCLSGGSSCKWYINPEIPEAINLMASAKNAHRPIEWHELAGSSEPVAAAEAMKVTDIKFLNPFKNKKKDFIVTVTIRKIDNSWWYNVCENCLRTAKPHGTSYRCSNHKCGKIGTPSQRYKLNIIAEDETADTKFIIFGRIAQRLVRKSADTLIAENLKGFIPDEITRLLEKTFVCNVSFTDGSIDSGNECFQVNAILGAIDSRGSTLPMSPTTSHSGSFAVSQGVSSNMQSPRKNIPLALSPPPTASEASNNSTLTPSKPPLSSTKQPATPQSIRNPAESEEEDDLTLLSQETHIKSPMTPQKGDADPLHELGTADKNAPRGGSTTKSHEVSYKKRTRTSPSKNTAKKLNMD